MKVAICGASILGLEAALTFCDLEAGVTLYAKEELEDSYQILLDRFPNFLLAGTWMDLTSSLGRKYILSDQNINFDEKPTLAKFYEKYISKLVCFLQDRDIFKKAEVSRIHKRSLTYNSTEKKRLNDLFRVVYRFHNIEEIKESIRENSDSLKNIEKNVLDNLCTKIESYEDFDLVVYASAPKNPIPAGAGGSYAINEITNSKSDELLKGLDEIFDPKKNELRKGQRVVLVGSSISSAIFLKDHYGDIFDKKVFFSIISDESEPFEDILLDKSEISEGVTSSFSKMGQMWEEAKVEYEKKLFEWRNLESFERVKVPEPSMPKNLITLYTDSQVVSIDKLIDQEGIFVTCEKGELLNTIRADKVIVAKEFSYDYSIFDKLNISFSKGSVVNTDGIIESEPGFYFLEENNFSIISNNMSSGEKKINNIIENVMSFFTRETND